MGRHPKDMSGAEEHVRPEGAKPWPAPAAFPPAISRKTTGDPCGGWRDVTRAHPCPICAKPDWCRITADGALAHCHRISPGGRPWPGTAGGHLHRLTDAPAVGYRVVEPRRHYGVNPLSPDAHDSIAQAILRELSLTEHHRDHLRARGGQRPLDDGAIAEQGYRTWPREGRAQLVRALLARGVCKEDLARFPGYVIRDGDRGPYATFRGAAGLLIPVRNAEGRIVAFRIRPDSAEGGSATSLGGKYRWLSSRSADHPDAPSPGTPLHVARPRWAEVAFDPTTVWITEGEIKANLSAQHLGAVVVSLPGVSVRAGVIDTLHALGARRVIIAFDADKRTKPHVAAAELALARELRDAGFEVLDASWPIEAGGSAAPSQGGSTAPSKGGSAAPTKGLDDLLVRGGSPSLAPYPFPREAHHAGRRLEAVPWEWVESRLPTKGPTVSVGEARNRIATVIRTAISVRAAGLDVLAVPPGVGKTVTALLEVQAAQAGGNAALLPPASASRTATAAVAAPPAPPSAKTAAPLGWRALFLADNHAQIAELLANPLLADLARVARVHYGRTAVEASPGFCAEQAGSTPSLSSALGSRRHGVTASYCKPKGGGSAAMNEGGRCPLAAVCAERGYLAHLADLREAPVVFATKGLLASDPSVLDGFALVIVDEDLPKALVERVAITRQVCDDWDAAFRHLPASQRSDAVGAWLILLHEVLAARGAEKGMGAARPFMPVLRESAARLGLDLSQITLDLARVPVDQGGRFPWERPFVEGREAGGARWVVPLRATQDLLDAIRRELPLPDGADSSLRLTNEGIVLLRVRKEHVQALSQKTVVNLDATPCLPLLSLLFPSLRHVALRVEEHVEVTQTVNALYTSSHVAGSLPRINALLDAMTRDESAPVILCAKRFDPNVPGAKSGGAAALARGGAAAPSKGGAAAEVLSVSNPRARFGHYDGESRGLDRFADASLIILVGHHSHNIGEVDAQVQAIRRGTTPLSSSSDDPEEVLVPYPCRTPDGQGLARRVKCHADPDVAAVVDWSRTSNVLQAIGRGRAALRPRDGRDGPNGTPAVPPLKVVILAGYPLLDVRVDRLTTVRELEGELGLAPSGPDRRGEALATANQARSDAFRERVGGAVAALQGREEEVCRTAVARELGVTDGGKNLQRIGACLVAEEVPGETIPTVPPSQFYMIKDHGGTVGVVSQLRPLSAPSLSMILRGVISVPAGDGSGGYSKRGTALAARPLTRKSRLPGMIHIFTGDLGRLSVGWPARSRDPPRGFSQHHANLEGPQERDIPIFRGVG